MTVTASDIREENKKRNKELKKEISTYNPYIGQNSHSIPRTFIQVSDLPISEFYAPNEMLTNGLVKSLVEKGSIHHYLLSVNIPPNIRNVKQIIKEVEKIRVRTDFEYTAVSYFRIKPKPKKDPITGKDIVIEGDIPFILNRGQRKLLKKLEELRLKGVPIRIILLKARQWGGSTLVQLYMAWLQLFHHKQWNSIICAHVENTAKIVKGMYTKLLKYIPPSLLDSESKTISMKPYEKSVKTSLIPERDCRITIGSAEKPYGVRGEDVVMAHCTEVGIWKKTSGKSPEEILNAVTSGIPYVSDTMIVYESTAKGVGNLFHREWLRAKEGKSDMEGVFVAWMDIENYSLKINTNIIDFINSLTEYEFTLWNKGATLEQINWYRVESKKYPDAWSMRQEYPSDAIEAFQSTGKRKFDIYQVDNMRNFCREPQFYGNVESEINLKDCDTPEKQKKYLKAVLFSALEGKPAREDNLLRVWELPSKEEFIKRRYVVSVDIGGTSDTSDWSVITVFDRKYMMEPGGVPEKVAQWRGHIDHDLLAWKAAAIASFYDNALLVIESNTLETEETEGQHFEYILDELGGAYENLYCRNSSQRIKENLPPKWGFHMNVSTKTLIIDNMVKMLRDTGYYERDNECCNEMDQYEIKENGSLGAIDGCHDDTLMATAIGVYVCYDFKYLPLPELYTPTYNIPKRNKNAQRTEATF